MSSLRPDTVLCRAPDLRLRVGNGSIEITVGAEILRCGAHTLDVLCAFARPTSFQDALKQLNSRVAGAADWVMWVETIKALAAGGALIGAGEFGPRISARTRDFGGAPVHIRMLNDRVRTSRLIAAIEAVVRPGDVVVEVGTGTGVLAVAAALAGARHVYAIEGGAMAAVAREIVQANGLADRITVMEGWSTRISLPEKADVFISETIGNAGFDENLLTIARDAVERFLRPGAQMIPRSLRLFARPMAAPTAWMARHHFSPEATRTWREWYGIDFARLVELPRDYDAADRLHLPTEGDWLELAAAVPVAWAEFMPALRETLSSTQVVTATRAGELNALGLFFESELAPGIVLSTDPRQPVSEAPNHWGNPVRLIAPLSLNAGERVRIDFAWEGGREKWHVRKD